MSHLTPMRRQYLQLKSQYPDAILFFRLGDFYETFDEDAKIVAQVCDITLTSRPVAKDQRVPLAGVPYHAADSYIAKLISAGYKVAIAEQVGSEFDQLRRAGMAGRGQEAVAGAGIVAQRGKLVPRQVVRVVTPGTVVEPTLLEKKRNNYLAALISDGDRAGLAYIDITTGEFATTQFDDEDFLQEVEQELVRLQPAEVIVPEQGGERKGRKGTSSLLFPPLPSSFHLTPFAPWRFELDNARRALLEHFQVATLAGFGCEGKPLAVRAAGAIIQYLAQTQPTALSYLRNLSTYSVTEFMILDAATRRNLELSQTIRTGRARGSLLWVLDDTVTAMGGRLLRRWINQPLLDLEQLRRRQEAVSIFVKDTPTRLRVRQLLKGLGDLERLTGRVVQSIARPRDLVGIGHTLEVIPQLQEALADMGLQKGPIAELRTRLDPCAEIAKLLSRAIVDDPPATLANGGVIRPGFSAELDGVLAAAREAKQWVAKLEQRERRRTGIQSLKVGYNKVFGYYLEVSKANLDRVPPEYIRKQTLVGAERYFTPELKEKESLILNTEERQLEIESRIFHQVCAQVAAASERLLRTAVALAELDVYAALAEVALRNNYVRPELNEGDEIEIIAGRHPVVELTQRERPFVPNDLRLSNDEEQIIVLTGPNMSGKCVRGDTLVFTDQGIVPIAELSPGDVPPDTFAEKRCVVDGQEGRVETSHFYNGGFSSTVRLRTRMGFTLEGTPEHCVWVRYSDGREGWKRLADIRPGDVVAIKRQVDLWGNKTAIDPSPAEALSRVKRYRLPTALNQDLAYLMGLLVGDGTLTYKDSLLISTGDAFIAEEIKRIIWEQFGYRVRCKANGEDLFVTSKQIRRFFECLGLEYCNAYDKHVPYSILQAPKPLVVAFLQGLFDADGTAEKRCGNVRLSTASARLAREVHLTLLNLGVVSSLQLRKTRANPSYRIYINGADAIRFYKQVGFRLPRKQAFSAKASKCHQNGVDCPELEAIHTQGYFYDYVAVTEEGQAWVYDLTVPQGHAFVANGFINHNSTYLRQVALIVLMAQIGSFVPADRATIGLVDRIFTRIGAQDEIASGRSTFMVEMVEMANILNHATPKSLLIIDEVGRGTSTYDGISIAWAVVEYIHNNPHVRAKTLFATHYHELTELADLLPRVRNYNVAVVEEGDKVIFLYKVVPGGADRSYGIHVAQLAGLPRPVIHRAEEVLEKLEATSRSPISPKRIAEARQLPLFTITDPLLEELKRLDVDSLTPLEAITKLYELKRGLEQRSK